ncbi:7289_t:CDS:2 [Acaulospora morrowiae]|uniref:7289_t:CDS:1 n=1 Tax=Acaulospora morrowiae TaxID=94023 RepID=A0A9N9CP64_9GLOM|nr:7289_t:CDS:2 [Acaulospora morrowiae]
MSHIDSHLTQWTSGDVMKNEDGTVFAGRVSVKKMMKSRVKSGRKGKK